MRFQWLAVPLAAACLAAANAAPPAPIVLDLLQTQQVGSACRISVQVNNPTWIDFSMLRLELVTFNPEGVIDRRMAVDLAPVSPEKLALKQFDLAGLSCIGLSRLLLNSVLACNDTRKLAIPDCLGSLTPSSRVDRIVFDK